MATGVAHSAAARQQRPQPGIENKTIARFVRWLKTIENMWPASHCASLSVNARGAIRPFVFFDLPRELRDMIYTYVVQSEGCPDYRVGVGRCLIGYKGMPRERSTSKKLECGGEISQEPNRQLLRTSRQFYSEIKHAYHRFQIFEFRLCHKLYDGQTVEHISYLPSNQWFRVENLAHVRIDLCFNREGANSVAATGFGYNNFNCDVPGFLQRAATLKTLQIAISLRWGDDDSHSATQPEDRLLTFDSGEPTNLLIGVVCELLASVPANVELKWARVYGLRYNVDDIEPEILESIARKYGKRGPAIQNGQDDQRAVESFKQTVEQFLGLRDDVNRLCNEAYYLGRKVIPGEFDHRLQVSTEALERMDQGLDGIQKGIDSLRTAHIKKAEATEQAVAISLERRIIDFTDRHPPPQVIVHWIVLALGCYTSISLTYWVAKEMLGPLWYGFAPTDPDL